MTEGFQDVSKEIQDVEKNISDSVITGMIRALQEAEKEKLQKVRASSYFTGKRNASWWIPV